MKDSDRLFPYLTDLTRLIIKCNALSLKDNLQIVDCVFIMGKSGVSPLFIIQKFLLSGSIDVDFFVETLPINTSLDDYLLHLSTCFPDKINSAPENIFRGFKLVMN